jgi:hypothetical protein
LLHLSVYAIANIGLGWFWHWGIDKPARKQLAKALFQEMQLANKLLKSL